MTAERPPSHSRRTVLRAGAVTGLGLAGAHLAAPGAAAAAASGSGGGYLVGRGISDATGEVAEFLLNASEREGWSWDAVARFAKEKFPSVGVLLEGPYGVTPQFETDRAETLLGMKWRSMQDTVGSYLEQKVELDGKA